MIGFYSYDKNAYYSVWHYLLHNFAAAFAFYYFLPRYSLECFPMSTTQFFVSHHISQRNLADLSYVFSLIVSWLLLLIYCLNFQEGFNWNWFYSHFRDRRLLEKPRSFLGASICSVELYMILSKLDWISTPRGMNVAKVF